MRISDWSSDVCSSDLDEGQGAGADRQATDVAGREHAAALVCRHRLEAGPQLGHGAMLSPTARTAQGHWSRRGGRSLAPTVLPRRTDGSMSDPPTRVFLVDDHASAPHGLIHPLVALDEN